MEKPIIVCVSDDRPSPAELLGPELNDRLRIEHFDSLGEAEHFLEHARGAGKPVLLALADEDAAGALPVTTYPILTGGEIETLRHAVGERLRRWEVERLQRRNDKLESLSDVGVALAGSFDIGAILETTHSAASRLVEGGAIDVLYRGCDGIRAQPMWWPLTPLPSNLNDGERATLATDAEAAAPKDRLCLPIAYQGEVLGALVVGSVEPLDGDTSKLLSILTLQTATALRNIHLNQERIHFERLAAVGRMIGSLVHDLRSPLTALRGFAGMLSSLKLDDSERRAYGRYITEECDRLDHMVEELLEFTRGGTSEPAPELVKLETYLEAFRKRLEAQFSERGVVVELSVRYSGDVLLDPARMERALWNVANNACQAMPDGGRLEVRAEALGDELVLSLEDEGTGIPEAVRHRIFEPFFSYGKAEGIGLGMLIAKNIALEHGGDIRVTSEAGQGTTVSFYLPLAAQERHDVVAAAEKTTK